VKILKGIMSAPLSQIVHCVIVFVDLCVLIPSRVTCVGLDLIINSIEIKFDLFTIAPAAFGRASRRVPNRPDRRPVRLGMISLNGKQGVGSQKWEILDFSMTLGFEEVWHVTSPVHHEKCTEVRARIMDLMSIHEVNMGRCSMCFVRFPRWQITAD